MIKILSQEKSEINTLVLKVATSKDKLHPLIEKKEWVSTLISEEKSRYLFVDKESDSYNFQYLYDYFVGFSSNNERSWNIDIKSFVAKSISEEVVIQAISEGILFGAHQMINYKQKVEEIEFEDEVSSSKMENEWSIGINTKNNGRVFYDIRKYGEIEIEKGRKYIFVEDYKTEKGNKQIRKIKEIVSYFLITKNKNSQKILENSQIKLTAVNFARDLQDTPPNKLHAKEFAEQVKNKFSKLKDVEVEILDKKQIEKNKMGLLLAVNAGSHHEPRVVILRHFGNPKSKEILGLVGKGITFDSGGYNLKPSSALQTMKFDMSGAVAVCSSFLTLAKNKPKINLVGIACLTENAIGGHATLTESVITSMSGKTVEINNTDAEGRLVLADGITYALQKEKVTKIITVATLTGAVMNALGENLTGILTNNRPFYRQLRQALVQSHERYWELPIIPENTKAIKENTTIADLGNISDNRYMGASSAAAFLQEFVEKKPFIHCDIAGTAVKTKTKRGTGVMVKTLIELFKII